MTEILKESIIFTKKPDSNIIEFDLDCNGLLFYKQNPLTQEQIDEGMIQDDSLIGSYAVFYDSLFKLAFYIYRPYIYQENNPDDKVWCDMVINEENNLLTITIPQDFYDNMMNVPCVLDPTLGYSTYSGTWEYKHYDYPATPSQSHTIATLAGTIPEDGEITSIHIMMKDDGTVDYEATFHAALYADNGSNFPSTRLSLSDTTHYVTREYTSYTEFVYPISYFATSGQRFWIGYDAISNATWKSSTWLRIIDTAPIVTTWIVFDRGVPNNLDNPFPTSPTPSSRTWAVNAWIEYIPTSDDSAKVPVRLLNQGAY